MRSSLLLAVGALAGLVSADDTQYWHERYHGLLSMAAYGDYASECPLTFTQATLLQSFPDSTEEPWTVLSEWGPTASGLEGFNVMIPEMDKIVMVFKGIYGWEQFNMSAVAAYLEAKEATNDWEIVKEYVNSTGHQWSMTGHGFGGMVAQVAALDLGWRGLSHWSHNHGSPRVFNAPAASLYNSLYAGEASQRTVANYDSVPQVLPESDDYTFTLEGFHIYGTNVTFGMNYAVCVSNVDDPECLGGNNITDHDFYYTPIGFCGGSQVSYNLTEQVDFESSESSAFYATATSTFVPASTSSKSSSAPTSATSMVESDPDNAGAASAASAVATTTSSSSAAGGAAGGLSLLSLGAILCL